MVRKSLTFLLLSLLMTGCAHNPHGHGGKFITEYRPGDTPDVKKAPYKALYALHHWQPPPCDPPPHTWVPEQSVCELYVRGLERRQCVGFEKGEDGQLYAVAGDEKILLEDGRYCWHITRESEYKGAQRLVHQTGQTAEFIVTAPLAVAGGAVGVVLFCITAPILLITAGVAMMAM